MAAMRLIKIPSIENTNPREMRRGAGEDYANFGCEARRAHSPGGDELRCCSCGAALLTRSSGVSRLDHRTFGDMQHLKSRRKTKLCMNVGGFGHLGPLLSCDAKQSVQHLVFLKKKKKK